MSDANARGSTSWELVQFIIVRMYTRVVANVLSNGSPVVTNLARMTNTRGVRFD